MAGEINVLILCGWNKHIYQYEIMLKEFYDRITNTADFAKLFFIKNITEVYLLFLYYVLYYTLLRNITQKRDQHQYDSQLRTSWWEHCGFPQRHRTQSLVSQLARPRHGLDHTRAVY